MKNTKRSTLGLMLGLTIALAGISYAQSNTQTDPNKKSDCCSTAMGCCGGDSCQMMKKDGAKNHASAADKERCCGCCGDSCQMMKKDAAKSPATSGDKEGCCGCCGDSCQMMKKDGMKNHTTSSSKEGCCCGESCDMKDGAKSIATAASEKHECCCGDSCSMHTKNTKAMTEKP